MTDYAELVKSLRYVAENRSTTSPEILTDAADAIEQLSTYSDFYEELTDKGIKTIRELLNKFPTWIPVTERLPGLHEEVLVCNEEYGLSGLGFATVAVWDGTDWIETWDRRDAIHCVSHWMPLSEPPTPVMEYPQVEGITPTVITPDEHSPFYESLKRGLKQAINGETREEETE